MRTNALSFRMVLVAISFAIFASPLIAQSTNNAQSANNVRSNEDAPSQLERFEFNAPTMGTTVQLVVYAPTESEAQAAISVLWTEMHRWIPIVNNYDPQSEVSQLSSTSLNEKIISEDLAEVLEESRRWHQQSAGAFDITIGPLTQLWRSCRKKKILPTSDQVDEARQRTGWRHVRIEYPPNDEDPIQLRLGTADMVLDVSGIATGYLIDAMADAVEEKGYPHYLINIGGDIRLGKSPPNQPGWKISIAGLGKDSPPVMEYIGSECAITTSGDLNQYVEIDGRRYSHLFDPVRGVPIERRQSVTVIAKKTVDADAGATAIAVMGREQASEQFSKLPLTAALILELDPEQQIRMRCLGRW